MTAQRVVMVVDMQNGVFATPRLARERCVAQINRLVRAADKVIFIQHDEAGGLEAGSEGFALLPELEQPAGALYVTKTACDAFYHTSLAQVLDEHDIQQFVICGCATDYCLDTTIKNGASRGYGIVIAEDAHTTADRPAAQAAMLIAHYNEVWRTLTIPGINPQKQFCTHGSRTKLLISGLIIRLSREGSSTRRPTYASYTAIAER